MDRQQQNLEELLELTTVIAARQLSRHDITHILPEQHRILFRTADRRRGDVEVFVNWDLVGEDAQKQEQKHVR